MAAIEGLEVPKSPNGAKIYYSNRWAKAMKTLMQVIAFIDLSSTKTNFYSCFLTNEA